MRDKIIDIIKKVHSGDYDHDDGALCGNCLDEIADQLFALIPEPMSEEINWMQVVKDLRKIIQDNSNSTLATLSQAKFCADYMREKIAKPSHCECKEKQLRHYDGKFCANCGKPLPEKEECKYSVISHGIGLSGKVEEIKVHCKMSPENDYTEVIDCGKPLPEKEEGNGVSSCCNSLMTWKEDKNYGWYVCQKCGNRCDWKPKPHTAEIGEKETLKYFIEILKLEELAKNIYRKLSNLKGETLNG